ncbi:MAG: Cell division trigger factor (EC [uncultured Sulfurovum sp.]|uniref:Trigger factor n=1 Tax=uncultured Sulfurovum sp. TaxID=269237 RepID=A0A6S6U1J7_9BACT|nr:MAG: Cell division trigger factor (EC [uncultured Sulfurovum sp.]
MNITATKTDAANVLVVATIDATDIEKNLNKAAKQIAKTASVDGFRKGKVPIAKVKQMYAEQLQQDSENQAIQDVLEQAKKDLDINPADIISDPVFKKYDKTDGNIETEMVISLRPTVEAEGYKDLAPTYDEPSIEDAEIEEKLKTLLAANAPYASIEEKRAIQNDDQVNFDFLGKVDGVEFDGGKAEGFDLVVGSGQFIPGFEDQMLGLNIEETRDLSVTFPEDYQSDDLKGKEAVFTVTINDIKTKTEPELDEEMIKKLIPNEEGATADTVKEKIAEQIKSEKVSKLYNETLKPALIEALVEKYDFALPQNIVDQEIDAQINNKAKEMSEDELASYKDNEEKINELRESVRETATNSVKATFLVDFLAKKEGVEINDQEVSQTIYYEAMMSGQDPQEVIKYYQENNLLPAVKMGMIEDKLFAKIIGIDQ